MHLRLHDKRKPRNGNVKAAHDCFRRRVEAKHHWCDRHNNRAIVAARKLIQNVTGGKYAGGSETAQK